jgi:hypothetical protein
VTFTQTELESQYESVWVHFTEFSNEEFKYTDDTGLVWVYLRVKDILDSNAFLPQYQLLFRLPQIAKIYDDSLLVYQRSTEYL